MQPEWGDATDYFHQRDMIYGTAELMIPGIVNPQSDITAATALQTTFGEHIQTLDIVP